MRRYETFVIIDPDISQDQRDPLIDRVKELIEQMNGFLAFTDHWGERKLAYEVRKKIRGYYVRFDYCASPELVNEIERFFRIDDRSMKYMTVLLDKEADLEKIKEEKAAAEKAAEDRAAAESAPDIAPEAHPAEKPAPEQQEATRADKDSPAPETEDAEKPASATEEEA